MSNVTSMLISRAASGFSTAARSFSPRPVRCMPRWTSKASASPTAGIKTCNGKMPILPITQGSSASADGRARGSLPNSAITTLSSTIPSATVAISQELVPRASNQAPDCTRDQRRGHRGNHRPVHPDSQGVANHGPEHHRRTLRKVHRAGDGKRQREPERDEAVDAAEANA